MILVRLRTQLTLLILNIAVIFLQIPLSWPLFNGKILELFRHRVRDSIA